MFEDENVLVTGGSGLIGRHLIDMLIKKGARIRTIQGNRHISDDPNVEKMKVDLLDQAECKRIMKDIRYVFHLAAFVGGVRQNSEHPATMISKNLPLNSNMIKAANDSNVEKYLFMSCGCVYPDKNGILTEDMAWEGPPASGAIHFGWTKRIGELETQAYQEEFGLKTAIVRPSNTYGPGDLYDLYRSHVVPALIMKAVNKMSPFEIWGNGESKRDFIYVSDVVNGIMLALEKYSVGDPINISTQNAVSINDLARIILNITNYESVKITHEHTNLGGSSSKVLSNKKAREKLNFIPKISLRDGLMKTIQAYTSSKHS